MVFFDEFDTLVNFVASPNGAADSSQNNVAGLFNQEMDTLPRRNPNVVAVAATNRVDSIDPSLKRPGRFSRKVYMPNPDDAGRLSILSTCVARLRGSVLAEETAAFDPIDDDISLPELAKATDGMSGAELAEIFQLALSSKLEQEARGFESTKVNQADLLSAAKICKRSNYDY